jgi:hypothetical protein
MQQRSQRHCLKAWSSSAFLVPTSVLPRHARPGWRLLFHLGARRGTRELWREGNARIWAYRRGTRSPAHDLNRALAILTQLPAELDNPMTNFGQSDDFLQLMM